jgi:hypothetical protein
MSTETQQAVNYARSATVRGSDMDQAIREIAYAIEQLAKAVERLERAKR